MHVPPRHNFSADLMRPCRCALALPAEVRRDVIRNEWRPMLTLRGVSMTGRVIYHARAYSAISMFDPGVVLIGEEM